MEPPNKKVKLDVKTASKPLFQDLPEEIIDDILEYCKINDILKLSEVNKFWNLYVKSSQKWMKKIALTVTEKNYKQIRKCNRLYQKVRVKSAPLIKSQSLKKALLFQLESIRDIEIPIINLSGIRFPNLRKMYLTNSKIYFRKDFIIKRDFYFTTPQKDTEERLKNDVQRAFSYYAAKLEVLHLEYQSVHHVEMAVEMLTNLKALKVSTMREAHYESRLKWETRSLGMMSHLRRPPYRYHGHIMPLTPPLNLECNSVNMNIIALDLSYNRFNSFLEFPNLQYLYVENVSWDNIKSIFQHMPHMKRVEFNYLYFNSKFHAFSNLGEFKLTLKVHQNIYFDKENKTNIKFVKCPDRNKVEEADFFANM